MRDATQALTVLAEIVPASRAVLEHRLAVIAADLDGNSIFRPRELLDTHFMALAIVDDRRGELPALLAWECNHDGRAANYLAAVARTALSISAVFECCAGDPAGGIADAERWAAWMLAQSRRTAGLHREPDPLLGGSGGHCHITIPANPIRIRLTNIPTVVTNRGGGYFFLPSRSALARIASGQSCMPRGPIA